MPLPSSEQPIYVLHQSAARSLTPKIVSLIFLGLIFYLGVLLNISLLELEAAAETTVKTVSLIILIVIIVSGIMLALRHARNKYIFYRNRMIHGKKTVYYTNITNTAPHQDLLDKLFKTYSINLSSDFSLRHIPQEIELQNYLQQLINYVNRK